MDETLSREEFDRVLVRFGDRGTARGARRRAAGTGGAGARLTMTPRPGRVLFLSQAIRSWGSGLDNVIMIIVASTSASIG